MEAPNFCPINCEFLSITEEEQNNQKNVIRPPHICNRYNKKLFHAQYHPNIIRTEECDLPVYIIGCDMANGNDQPVILKVSLDLENKIVYIEAIKHKDEF